MYYYYPFCLHLLNPFSFRHYNTLDISNNDINSNLDNFNQPKTIKLWSLLRKNNKYIQTEYIAKYNFYTKNFEFRGKRYISYVEMVDDAMQI